MNDDVLNMSLRKFLKKGRHHGPARHRGGGARRACASGSLKGGEKLPAQARLTLGGTTLDLVIEGDIELE